jgi:hypothetical protein
MPGETPAYLAIYFHGLLSVPAPSSSTQPSTQFRQNYLRVGCVQWQRQVPLESTAARCTVHKNTIDRVYSLLIETKEVVKSMVHSDGSVFDEADVVSTTHASVSVLQTQFRESFEDVTAATAPSLPIPTDSVLRRGLPPPPLVHVTVQQQDAALGAVVGQLEELAASNALHSLGNVRQTIQSRRRRRRR